MQTVSLGTLIRNRRDKLNKTQSALAAAAKVDPSSLSRWERDVVKPRMDEFERLCAALGTTPGALLREGQKRSAA